VSIGEVLTAARNRAGLTVREVSEDTRIRESIIRGIERDDYAGCGGDFYARGHIRAIARAVGTDPRPLIEEYDAAQRARELATASAFAASVPAGPGERLPGGRGQRHLNWTLVLSILVVLALVAAGYFLFHGSGHAKAGTGISAPVTRLL
jgi:cytoskeletal protein RodZ